MFSKPYAHWHVLATCTCPEEIPRPTWEYIQNVARRIAQADFTAGSAAEMGARLRASLGFADWAELKNAASLEADLIDFKSISDTIQNEFDGSISRYESAQDHGFEATHKKIQRLRKRRGLCLRKRTGRPLRRISAGQMFRYCAAPSVPMSRPPPRCCWPSVMRAVR